MTRKRISLEQRIKDAFGADITIYDLWRTLLAKEDINSLDDLKKRESYIIWNRFDIEQLIYFQIPHSEDVIDWEAKLITNAIINKTRQYYYGKKINSYSTSSGKSYKFNADSLAYDLKFSTQIFTKGRDFYNKKIII